MWVVTINGTFLAVQHSGERRRRSRFGKCCGGHTGTDF